MKNYITLSLLLSTALAACGQTKPQMSTAETLKSAVITSEQADLDDEQWGQFRAFYSGDTHGLSGALVGTADIKAGEEIHPAHRHGDEEFLVVTAGYGTWHLNGKDFPAKTGDVLYAAPWDYHGIKAAPDSELQFFVVKFGTKAIAPPTDPDPSLPEELAR